MPERLAARRLRRRRRALLLSLLALLVAAGGFCWLSWQPFVRISHVSVTDSQLLPTITQELSGTYAHLIPHDSFFFLPGRAIRAAILSARPELAAVSVARKNLTTIIVKLYPRIAVALWCDASSTPQNCFVFDASGYVFAPADASTTAINDFVLYAPLAASDTPEVGAIIADASALPNVFAFARAAGSFGSPVSTITFRGDEVDDVLQSGTRVTYVLGQEQQAFADLEPAVRESINLADGSLEYVDLRFPGKVYVKKK